MPTVDDIREALRSVMDPEIPTISLVDLGVITNISITPDNVAHISMTPTFTGCPAIDYMRDDVRQKVGEMGFADVVVSIDFDVQWNSNRVTEEGRK
ncbi:MAG: metal-sulfur cluster assembly factor, partial [Candidatus Kapaibacterium sp.]